MTAMLATPMMTNEGWLLDSGATHHLTPNTNTDLNLQVLFFAMTKWQLRTINHFLFCISSISLPLSSSIFSLRNVFHVLDFSSNLVNVSKFCADNKIFVEFYSGFFPVKDLSLKKVLKLEHDLYKFQAMS